MLYIYFSTFLLCESSYCAFTAIIAVPHSKTIYSGESKGQNSKLLLNQIKPSWWYNIGEGYQPPSRTWTSSRITPISQKVTVRRIASIALYLPEITHFPPPHPHGSIPEISRNFQPGVDEPAVKTSQNLSLSLPSSLHVLSVVLCNIGMNHSTCGIHSLEAAKCQQPALILLYQIMILMI